MEKTREEHIGALALKDWVTLASAACGIAAVAFAFQNQLTAAIALVVLSAVFDFLDGRVARSSGQSNELGMQLDSLSDAIAFGAAPAAIVISTANTFEAFVLALACSIVFVASGVVRLARFNLQKDKSRFIGLPIPAAALMVLAVAAVMPEMAWLMLLATGAAMVSSVRINKVL